MRAWFAAITLVIAMDVEERRRGRPPSFDRTAAVRIARDLFWRHGYEGVSISTLVEAIGIAPPSLYAAFGSKEQLFLEALAVYVTEERDAVLRALEGESSAREVIKRVLYEAAEKYPRRKGHPGGCFVATGALACAPENEAIERELVAVRKATRRALQKRLDRAKAERELPAKTDVPALASFYAVVIQGMSVQARDGADEASLKAVSDAALRVWPAPAARD